MDLRKRAPVIAGAFALAFATVAFACDGWRRVEEKNRRYELIELTQEQKQKIDQLKQQAVANFRNDHGQGGCDEQHARTLQAFQTEADTVLTNAQRMELRTAERIQGLENEVRQLRHQNPELTALVRPHKK
jgi:hypothetical protein